jgi:hypothetical protein
MAFAAAAAQQKKTETIAKAPKMAKTIEFYRIL